MRLLEEIVKEKLIPFGYGEVEDSVEHVNHLREKSKHKTDEAFLKKIFEWQKSTS